MLTEERSLGKVFRILLPIAKEWKNIGTILNISNSTLDKISADEGGVHDCLRAMLAKWLKQVDPAPTWAELVDAVEPFNEGVATRIRLECAD